MHQIAGRTPWKIFILVWSCLHLSLCASLIAPWQTWHFPQVIIEASRHLEGLGCSLTWEAQPHRPGVLESWHYGFLTQFVLLPDNEQRPCREPGTDLRPGMHPQVRDSHSFTRWIKSSVLLVPCAEWGLEACVCVCVWESRGVSAGVALLPREISPWS